MSSQSQSLSSATAITAPGATDVPAFLLKLWKMVEDPTCDRLISWGKTGTSFVVYDQSDFAKEILPRFFKHNNFASFVRQLNMYGFRKIVSPSQGSLYSAAKENFEFFHSNFQKDRFDLLDQVKRKHSRLGSGGESTTAVKSEDLERALVDIQSMKNRQKEICENLDDLGKDNKVLRDEVAFLRQRSQQQQVIINKLLNFLLRILYSNRADLLVPGHRRKRLALTELDEVSPPPAKVVSVSGGEEGEGGSGSGVADDNRYPHRLGPGASVEGDETNLYYVSSLPSPARETASLLPSDVLSGGGGGGGEMDALLKSAATSSGNITTFPTELALSLAEDSDVSSHPIPQLSQLSQLSQLPMITADSAPSHSSTALLPTSTGGSILQHILGSVHGDTDDEIARKNTLDTDSGLAADTNALSEHLDHVDTGLSSVKSMFNHTIDPLLLQELFSDQPGLALDPNSEMMLDSLSSGETPSEEQVSNLREMMDAQGLRLLPLATHEQKKEEKSSS